MDLGLLMTLWTWLEGATGIPPAQLAAYALAALTAWTVLVHVLTFGARRFALYAATTPDPHDDEQATRMVAFANALQSGTMALWRWVPRLAWGRQPPEPPAPARRTRTTPPLPLLVLGLAALLAPLSAGCGATALDTARVFVLTSASGLDAVDRVAAPAYTDAAQRCSDDAADLDGYRACVEPWDGLVAGAEGAHATILGAESSVDAAAAGEGEMWLPMGACIVAALGRVVDLLLLVGLPIPGDVAAAVQLGATYASMACPEGGL